MTNNEKNTLIALLIGYSIGELIKEFGHFCN